LKRFWQRREVKGRRSINLPPVTIHLSLPTTSLYLCINDKVILSLKKEIR
jgi:hypothetical protein